jgi:glycosyltransferase involved in cell wall biosynthesis
LSEIALSVCIPAFNDSLELEKTLVSLQRLAQEQPKETSKKIEVLISDNASTDNSNNLIESFNLDHITVRKFRQEYNLGFRGNIEFLSSKAVGDWTFFMSCGDVLVENLSFDDLISKLDVTLCDTAFYSFEMVDVLSGSPFSGLGSKSAFVAAQSDILYSPAPMPFFRSAALKKIIETKPNVTGDWWPHIEWALFASEVTGSAAYLNPGPITGNRPSEGWWSKPLAYRSVIELAILLEKVSFTHKEQKRLRNDAANTWKTLPSWVFQTRVVYGNVTSWTDYQQLFGVLSRAPMIGFMSLAVLACPLSILNLARTLRRSSVR